MGFVLLMLATIGAVTGVNWYIDRRIAHSDPAPAAQPRPFDPQVSEGAGIISQPQAIAEAAHYQLPTPYEIAFGDSGDSETETITTI